MMKSCRYLASATLLAFAINAKAYDCYPSPPSMLEDSDQAQQMDMMNNQRYLECLDRQEEMRDAEDLRDEMRKEREELENLRDEIKALRR